MADEIYLEKLLEMRWVSKIIMQKASSCFVNLSDIHNTLLRN